MAKIGEAPWPGGHLWGDGRVKGVRPYYME